MKNRIRELRKNMGLTQKKLGNAVGLSQPQIQRVEAGISAPRFDLCKRICKELMFSFDIVFPSAKKPFDSYNRKKKRNDNPYRDEKFVKDMNSAGIDMDIRYHSIKFHLRGGYEDFLYNISVQEKDRLWDALQGYNDNLFFEFNSDIETVILNVEHLIFCQFLSDMHPVKILTKENDLENYSVTVVTCDKDEPFMFNVDSDETNLNDDGAEWEHIQFQDISHRASFLTKSDNNEEVFMFKDDAGETAFFRAKCVAMMKIPFEVISPDCRDLDENSDD